MKPSGDSCAANCSFSTWCWKQRVHRGISDSTRSKVELEVADHSLRRAGLCTTDTPCADPRRPSSRPQSQLYTSNQHIAPVNQRSTACFPCSADGLTGAPCPWLPAHSAYQHHHTTTPHTQNCAQHRRTHGKANLSLGRLAGLLLLLLFAAEARSRVRLHINAQRVSSNDTSSDFANMHTLVSALGASSSLNRPLSFSFSAGAALAAARKRSGHLSNTPFRARGGPSSPARPPSCSAPSSQARPASPRTLWRAAL